MMQDAVAQNMNYECIRDNWYIVGLDCVHYRKIDLKNTGMHINIYKWVINAI